MRRPGFQGVLVLALLAGCAAQELPVAVVDNAEYSVATGMRFLGRGQYGPALAEFERARALNENFAPAYLGIALAKAHLADAGSAMAALEEARRRNATSVHATAIRVLTILKPPKWLDQAEREFEAGGGKSARDPELLLAMGRAYKAAFAFDRAAALLSQVLAQKLMCNSGFGTIGLSVFDEVSQTGIFFFTDWSFQRDGLFGGFDDLMQLYDRDVH